MKKALATGAILISFSCSASAESGGICDPGKAAVGAVIGLVVGTLIFPGIGTALGASLGGGGTCGVDFAWLRLRPSASAGSDPVQTIVERTAPVDGR